MGPVPGLVPLLDFVGGRGRLPRYAAYRVGAKPIPRVHLLGYEPALSGSVGASAVRTGLLSRLDPIPGADRRIDQLWAGELPDGSDTRLKSYVSRLQATLGGVVAITSGGGGYAIEADSCSQRELVLLSRRFRPSSAGCDGPA